MNFSKKFITCLFKLSLELSLVCQAQPCFADNQSTTSDTEKATTASVKYAAQGKTLEQAGDDAGAIQNYSKAIELTPDAYDFVDARARLRKKTGDEAGAAQDFKDAGRIMNMMFGNRIGQSESNVIAADWDAWQDALQSFLISKLARVKTGHPEFSCLPNKPHRIGFEVTNECLVANALTIEKSATQSFDRETRTILFFLRGAKFLTFPPDAKDTFIRCKVSFYPNGNVSLISIEHPDPKEVFERKDTQTIFLEPPVRSFPPDIDERRK